MNYKNAFSAIKILVLTELIFYVVKKFKLGPKGRVERGGGLLRNTTDVQNFRKHIFFVSVSSV